MKKNSFKRFLAVTLAAATALTFAPVSTLGLTGVVQAEAADTDTDVTKTIDWSTVGASDTGAASFSVNVAKTNTSEAKLTLTGLTASNVVTFTDSDTTNITTKLGSTALTSGNAHTVAAADGNVITFTAPKTAKSGNVTVKVDNTTPAEKSITYTISFTVKNSDEKVSVVDGSDKTLSSLDIPVKASGNAGTGSATIKIADTIVGEKVYLYGYDSSKIKVSGTSLADGAYATTADPDSYTITVTAVDVGSTTINIKTEAGKEASLTVNVLDSVAVDSAKVSAGSTNVRAGKTDEVGTIVYTGKNMSSTVTTNQPEAPEASVVTAVQALTAGATAGDIHVTIGALADATVTSTTASFPIKVTANAGVKVGNQYKITISGNAYTNGPTIASTDITVTIVNAATSSFTYGGVLKDILAYKDASYDLAEHAAVSYLPADTSASKINLTGSELTWWLVDGTTDGKFAVGDQRADLKKLNIPATDGTIAQGSTGSLKVTVADADKFGTDVNGAILVAEATIKGTRTVVYKSSPVTVTKINTKNVAVISKTITASVSDESRVADATKLPVLDEQIANPTQDNKYLKAKEVSFTDTSEKETKTNYDLTVVKASGDDNPFKGSYLTLEKSKLSTGTYYETAYIPFKVNGDASDTTYIQKVDIVVSVNAGVHFRIKDGASILTSNFANDTIATDPTVYLNLVDAKTWNIKDHLEADVADISKVNFSYRSDSANVDVDSNGVLTAKSVGNAIIYVKATYNNIPTAEKELHVRVNKNGFDTITVTGKDGDQARVLGARDYNNNSVNVVTKEQNLVTKQIPYVQIEITGKETSNVTETPVVTSKNNAKLTYEFVKDYSSDGLTIDPATGKITIDYTKCTDGYNTTTKKWGKATAMGVYAVKVVSDETNASAATTSYYYVVVDYPDKPFTNVQDNYTVGACSDESHGHVDAVELYKESKYTVTSFYDVQKNTNDDFIGIGYYKDDNTSAFKNTGYVTYDRLGHTVINKQTFAQGGVIARAYTANQTEHIVAYNDDEYEDKTGYTAKLITVKSAPAVENYVDKIVNKETGEVLYDHSVNDSDTARELKIDKVTTIKVSLKYPVKSASAVSGCAVTLGIYDVSDNGAIINQNRYVTAVKNSKDVDVALYPNEKGTQVIEIDPEGHLTNTDRTDIHHKVVKLAVTYTGEAADGAKNPAQVKGVKVSNKKGAKVTVKFKKITANSTMRYYVQKKIGKKVSGKSIGSTKTTLSVKKGATVKVRVKAYYYDANGVKHVGKYSSWKTLKTDKK